MKALHPQMTKGFLSPQLKEIDINDCYFQSESSMNKKHVLFYSTLSGRFNLRKVDVSWTSWIM